MSDDRWGWVTAAASTNPPRPTGGVEQKQHFTNAPVAAHDALDLWTPTTAGPVDADPVPIDRDGPGDDATTAQRPALARQNLSGQWTPANTDGLDQLVADGRAKRARVRSLRRAGIVAGFLAVVTAVIVVGAVEIEPGDAPSSPSSGSAPEGWCATGTKGDTTTVAAGGTPTTPTGAVATFISALVDVRSAAAARVAMSQTAPAPTLDQLANWITAIPASTNGWCAQVTTTDSATRVLVELRLHSGSGPVPVAGRNTFYVSATTPTSWSIDAIVSDEGSQP